MVVVCQDPLPDAIGVVIKALGTSGAEDTAEDQAAHTAEAPMGSGSNILRASTTKSQSLWSSQQQT